MGILSWGFGEWKQRFSDCVAEVYAILCSCKGTQAESAYAESAQESTLRGFRREVRFIMSPPGKRRHNELNAAPPPETPRGTGATGGGSDRDVVHSGESFCVRGKNRSFSLPLEGKVSAEPTDEV